MKKFHLDRLRKLADHLMHGKLGHKKFDFSCWNSDKELEWLTTPYKCAYLGCAIGECPIVFSRDWKFGQYGPEIRKTNEIEISAAQQYFALGLSEAEHLFIPDSQNPMLYGGVFLRHDATRKQVAKNIYAFIKIKEKELANV